jgi:glutaredoxin
VNLYLFWGDGCPHCAHAKELLDPYVKQNDFVGYNKYEIYYNTENQKKMQAVGEMLKIDASGVPLIIVGDKPYIGFSNSTGEEIKDRLEYCSINACPDSVADIVGVKKPIARAIPSVAKEVVKTEPTNNLNQSNISRSDKYVDLPLLGKINTAHFSLPVLTVVIGLLDGFNPCAMWALLFIITLLLGMHDRKKMWLYGTTFIATSAVVYFIFMAAWLNIFMFIGHITWMRSLIGLLAIAAGGYYLYDWHKKKTGCKITGTEKRKEVFVKLREIVKEKNIWLGLGGIILLALAVNIVELACSAGLPVLYTGILSSAGLEVWQYYAYMLLYILFFMLDDLVVFFIAMTTLKVIGIESKYSRVTRLVGGVLMCIIGLLLIFAPQVLMFG